MLRRLFGMMRDAVERVLAALEKRSDPNRTTLLDIAAVLGRTMLSVRDAISERLAKPERLPQGRASFLRLPAALVLSIAAAGGAKVTQMMQPVEQPVPVAQSANSAGTAPGPAHPDMPIDELMRCLDTAEALQAFLETHTRFDDVGFPVRFVQTFRQHPEAFRRSGWTGPCNTYANFTGEWAAARGLSSYTVSMWPENPGARLAKAWHSFQAICIADGKHYIVFDNQSMTDWHGSLEEYVAEKHPRMRVLPAGGIVLWRRTQENFLGSLSLHFHANQTVHRQEMVPRRPVAPPVVTALR